MPLTARSTTVRPVSERPPKQEQERATAEVTEVGPGVLRMQLPIEMPGLGHVNCYALVDGRGAAVVDPGLPGPATWAALVQRLGRAGLKPADVHTVVVTHSHPDHYGTAQRLAEEAGADLAVHSAFRTWWDNPGTCDDEVADVDPDDLPEENPWEGATTPWGGEGFSPPPALAELRDAGAYVAPRPTRCVRDGERLVLAGRELVAVHTPGHTLDHLCLHDPEGGLLFSGDHVLPTITPHVSGVGTGRDPLAKFVASLDKVAALPGVRTVLPAHGHPFGDLAGRVEAIKEHHVERLERIRAVAAAIGPASVTEFSHHLFREARWGPMAESEAYAHLEHLRLAGEAERHDERGRMVYEVAPARA